MNAAHNATDTGSSKAPLKYAGSDRRIRTLRPASWLRPVVAGLCLLIAGAAAHAQTATATVPAGISPVAVGVNPVTNEVYVANSGDGTITAINGLTNSTTTITVGTTPSAVAVNPVTDLIYVLNNNNGGTGSVSVINGATNTVTGSAISVGSNPIAIALNPVTNKIYVANEGGNSITVIDANNGDATASVTVGTLPVALAVNAVTNEIYVANYSGNSVSVIQGSSNSVGSPIAVGLSPTAVAVNPVTNHIFVANYGAGSVTVIAGSPNSVTGSAIATGAHPNSIAVNPVTNKIYVANQGGGSSGVTVIDGTNLGATPTNLTAGSTPFAVAVNQVTNQVYVANHGSTGTNGLTVINGATSAVVASVSTTLNTGTAPQAIGVNPVTGKVYVVNKGTGTASTVTVVDGATNSTTTASAGTAPGAVVVNPVTNKIYVVNGNGSNTVTVIDGTGTNAPANVTVGNFPCAVDVNPITNKIYVVNQSDNTVSVIDGSANPNVVVSTINVGKVPDAVAVNPVTNKIYAVNYYDGSVSVIDGGSNTVVASVGLGSHPQAVVVNPATNRVYFAVTDSNYVVSFDGANNPTIFQMGSGASPSALAVNPVTNKIYVANIFGNNVQVIDGNSNTLIATGPITVGNNPNGVSVNPVTNKIYVSNQNSNSVSVIDGTMNTTASTTSITVGQNPWAVAVNPVTNKIYVPDLGKTNGSYFISIIDGATGTVTSAPGGTQPGTVAVNPVTAQIYVPNQDSYNVSVITEQQTETIPVTTTIQPLVGNTSASLTPAFTFTTSNTLTNSAPVDNVLYQVDTWQGPWTPATGGSGSFSATLSTLSPGFHILYAYATEGQEGTSNNTGLQSSPLIGSIAAYGFLIAPAGAGVSPSSLTFTSQTAKTSSPAQTVTLTNAGAQTLTYSMALSDTADYSVSGGTCNPVSGTLAVGASCTVGVVFNPQTSGSPFSATLTVTDNSNGIPGSTQTVSLSGTGTGNANAGLAWTAPSSIVYGTPLSSIQLDATTTVANVPADGTLAYQPAVGTVLGVGPHNLTVTFTPSQSGGQTYQSSQLTVSITVTPVTLTVTAASIASSPFGQTPAYSSTYSGFVNGDGPSVVTGTPTYTTSPAPNPLTVGTYTIIPGTAGLSAANYVFSPSAVVTGTLNVVKATPTITWGAGGVLPAISYGTSLAGSLNASSTATGGNSSSNFSYTANGNPVTGATILPAGTQSLGVTFIPTDLTDYNSPVTATVSLTVNKAAPSIATTTTGNANLKYGTAVTFSTTLSNATSTPTGSVSFYDASGGATCASLGTSTLIGTTQTLVSGGASVTTSTIKAGSHTVLACYSGDTNFLAASGSVSQVVGQATPVITWTTPAPINYGTALSGGQLDATVANNLPGTFNYTPSTGSVLGTGSQTLNVTFVPTDTVDYTTATGTATLIVNQAPPNSQATVTTTAITGSGPKALAVNPATNQTYVANVGSGTVTVINGATNTTSTIAVGNQPDAVAINTVTNQIYVANYADGTVTIIDGTGNNSPSTITVGTHPTVIAVNPQTNKAYVVNSGSGTVTVINGNQSNAATAITVGLSPFAAAVNPVTNKIYVTNQGTTPSNGSVSVIDGSSDTVVATVTDPAANNPYSVAVNAATNKVYVTNLNSNTVTVIDPVNSNAVTSITVGQTPWAVAVNEITNQVYVANYGAGTVTVINANNSNGTTPVTVGTNPIAVAVNSITNQIFVANLGSQNFTVIDGASNNPTNVAAGSSPVAVAVNPVTDKIYVANNGSGNVSVVDGATNTTSTTGTSAEPVAVAVNPVTNTIYTANYTSPGSVTVITGSTVSSVPVGTYPTAIAVNPLTNKVYTVNSTNITVIDGATNTPTSYTVGVGPNAVALNPVTNEAFFTNYNDNTVAVFNAATNTLITSVGVGTNPAAVAVNPVTNKIYVASIGNGGTVTVVDGTTNTATATVTVGDQPWAIAVNPVTNKIFVVNSNFDNYPTPGSVTVIDGVTNQTTTIPAGVEPYAIAVNQVANKIYVVNKDSNNITVIDGNNLNGTPATLAVGSHPYAIAVNPVSNKIYVPNAGAVNGSYYVSVIDGATNFITTLAAGDQPVSVAVNPVTNQVYITNQYSNNIMALTEQQVQTIPITTTIQPLAGNQTANLVPTFTFNTSNTLTGAPVENVFYQIDTWQGTWTPATNQGSGTFTATTPALLPGYHILYAYATDGQDSGSTITGAQNSPLVGNIAAYGFAEVAQTGGGTGANVSPSALSFGTQAKATTSAAQTATLLNASNATLTFSISFTGANAGDFAETIGSDTCSTLAGQLAPNASCTIGVTFTPAATGSRGATLKITDNSNGVSGSTQTVSLSGTGTGNTDPGLSWTPPSSIVYGTSLTATQNATTTVAQIPADGTLSYQPSTGNLGVGQQTLVVTFTPSQSGAATYKTAQLSVTISVTPATLTVTPANAARQYKQANPVFTANYTGFVNGDTSSVLTGSPQFSTTATISSNVGMYPITVTQGTLAAANYTFSFATGANLTVNAATTIITWGPLAPISAGAALSSSQLNATATIADTSTVPGTFNYSPALGAVLPAGTQTLSVTFTPTGAGAANYTTASGTTTLQVNQATAAFSMLDTTTQGSWLGVYGDQGYSIAPSGYQSLPSYITFGLQNQTNYTWLNSTTDPRALQLPSGTGRIAGTWYAASSFSMAVNFTDGKTHQLDLYALDWEAAGRNEQIQVTDAVTNAVLDTETISGFTNGVYLVWNISGSVNITVTSTVGNANAVISGIFFTTNNTAENVTVKPAAVSLSSGGTQQFTATVTNGTGQPTWTISNVSPIGAPSGTLSNTGFYTAPTTTTTTTVTVTATSADQTATGTATVLVLPPSTNYVTSTNLGTLRNNYTGWIGMSVTVGSSPVTVTALGRIFAPGNTGTHMVKIVNAANSQDVAGGSASISMSGGTTGNFVYVGLPVSVTLNANTTYYIVSQETSGGDQWYDANTTIQTASVASETAGIWSPDGATYNAYGSASQAYVPVDFKYTVVVSKPVITQQPQSQSVSVGATATFTVAASGGSLTYQWSSAPSGSSTFTAITGATASSYTTPATTLAQTGTQFMCTVTDSAGSTPSNAATLTVVASLPTTNYVTSFGLGTPRSNFTGWIGMRFTVGSSPVTVTALGRYVASGSSGSHTMKIVNAANSQDVTGASVSVSTSGATVGTFAYANLASSVTLNANTTYYLMSQEASGGDTWYDMNTSIQTTAVAAETAAIYSYDGATYFALGSANQSYGPVGFLYSTAVTQPVITQQPQNQSVSTGATATFTVAASGGNLSYQWSSAPSGSSTFTAITGATASSYTTPATTLAQTGTQFMCTVTNSAGSAPSNAATLTVVASLPTTNYVTSFGLGTARNNFTGWVGMSFTVGSSPVTVTGLGRIVASGSTGSHTLKLVNAANSQDVTGGSVSVPTSGGTAGTFAYANLASSVTLNANTTYYLMSQEASGGDTWYDANTTIQTSGVAVEKTPIYSYDGATYNAFGSANESYGPVDFLYSTAVTQPVITQQPQNQSVSVGATATFTVAASGGSLTYQWSSAPSGSSTFTAITGATASSYTTPATTLAQTGTQFMCTVTDSAGSTPSNAATLTVVASLPTTNYVTSFGLGTPRSNFTGWIGMRFTVGSSPVTVTALGRYVASGSSGSHTMKIVNAANSQDVTGASVSVPTSGATVGTFAYANLASSVTLNANTTYYLMSQEASGGDTWYDMNTSIQTTAVAAETAAIYSYDGATYFALGSANQSYGPVGFLYSTAVTQPVITQQPQNQSVSTGAAATFTVAASGGNLSYQWSSAPSGSSTFTAITGATASSYTTPATTLAQTGTQFMCTVTNSAGSAPSNAATLTVAATPTTANYVTSSAGGTLRNNFTGWVGMTINVGNAPIVVTGLGRMVASGNTGVHTLKVVSVSGADVAGGSTSVSTSGAPSGKFIYGNLSNPLTLQANTTYYIVSQETSGGDQWFDLNSVQTNTVASDISGVWSPDGSTYNQFGSANQAYVPVDFQYTTQASASFVTAITFTGPSQSNFTGWVGAAITTGASSVTVTQLGRYRVFGNSGTHTVKLVAASTGIDVSGSAVSVNVAGGQVNAFVYAALSSPVTLSPNTTYYVVSQETAGGDSYYNFNTTVQTASVASDISSVGSPDGTTYTQSGGTNQMTGPVSFIYLQ